MPTEIIDFYREKYEYNKKQAEEAHKKEDLEQGAWSRLITLLNSGEKYVKLFAGRLLVKDCRADNTVYLIPDEEQLLKIKTLPDNDKFWFVNLTNVDHTMMLGTQPTDAG